MVWVCTVELDDEVETFFFEVSHLKKSFRCEFCWSRSYKNTDRIVERVSEMKSIVENFVFCVDWCFGRCTARWIG